MGKRSLKDRVAALEAEVARLKAKAEGSDKPSDPWMEKVWGAFANDPDFLEAMRLGREYRVSLRPRSRQHRKRKQ
jgi:hypothetical protein